MEPSIPALQAPARRRHPHGTRRLSRSAQERRRPHPARRCGIPRFPALRAGVGTQETPRPHSSPRRPSPSSPAFRRPAAAGAVRRRRPVRPEQPPALGPTTSPRRPRSGAGQASLPPEGQAERPSEAPAPGVSASAWPVELPPTARQHVAHGGLRPAARALPAGRAALHAGRRPHAPLQPGRSSEPPRGDPPAGAPPEPNAGAWPARRPPEASVGPGPPGELWARSPQTLLVASARFCELWARSPPWALEGSVSTPSVFFRGGAAASRRLREPSRKLRTESPGVRAGAEPLHVPGPARRPRAARSGRPAPGGSLARARYRRRAGPDGARGRSHPGCGDLNRFGGFQGPAVFTAPGAPAGKVGARRTTGPGERAPLLLDGGPLSEVFPQREIS